METPAEPDRPPQDVVIVTGPSGAGRSTAINALEDLGFEAIDNLPLSLLERLLAGGAHDRPLAIGIDPRTRDFSPEGVALALSRLALDPAHNVSLVFLDCDTDTLLRRFSETRRRHPLAPQGTPLQGIDRERSLLAPLVDRAEVMIDTSELSPHELRAEIGRWFGGGRTEELSVSLQSFSYKRGLPRSADMVLDCRFLKNPHWTADLRPLTGQDSAVGAFIETDPLCQPFLERSTDMVELLLPAYKAEGKAYFTLALGCTGGRHRSVYVAESLANGLAQAGWRVSIRHRELERAPREVAPREVVET